MDEDTNVRFWNHKHHFAGAHDGGSHEGHGSKWKVRIIAVESVKSGSVVEAALLSSAPVEMLRRKLELAGLLRYISLRS